LLALCTLFFQLAWAIFSYSSSSWLLFAVKPPLAVRLEILRDAVKGAGTADKRVIDMICTASNWEINEMKRLWPSLVHDVESDLSGNFKKVISKLLHVSALYHIDFSPNSATFVSFRALVTSLANLLTNKPRQ